MYAHAYVAAVLGNFNVLCTFNITQNESFIGRAFPFNNFTQSNVLPSKLQYLDLGTVSAAKSSNTSATNKTGITSNVDLQTLCNG